MKIRSIRCPLIGIVLLLLTSAAMSANEVDLNYINTLTSRFSTVTISDVEENLHGYSFDDIVQELLEMDAKYTASHSTVVIRLKHQPTIRKYLNRFTESNGADLRASSTLIGSRAPWLIPHFAKNLDGEKIEMHIHPNPERIGYYGLSGTSLQAIHFIAMRSKDLPEEVNQWASSIKIRGEKAMNEAQPIYQKWWELNKAAFESENYSKVLPLADSMEHYTH